MSKLDDPTWRSDRAWKAGKSRTTVDYYIKKLIESAPALTSEQIEKLRALLPMEVPLTRASFRSALRARQAHGSRDVA